MMKITVKNEMDDPNAKIFKTTTLYVLSQFNVLWNIKEKWNVKPLEPAILSQSNLRSKYTSD